MTQPEYLTLINKTHSIEPQFTEKIELVEAVGYDGEIFRAEKHAAEQFQKLQQAVKEYDIEIVLSSAYRSIERQKQIKAQLNEEYGTEYVRNFVAEPGTSEHHTGLALDFVAKLGGKWVIETAEINRRIDEMRPVYDLLPKYGFILRYLPGKEEITGYPAEPWHIRYVGDPEVATEIADKGITLEEYLGEA